MPFFDHFYPFIKENFNKNYEKLLEFAENKHKNDFVDSTILKTGYYSICIDANYQKVIEKLKEAKIFVEKI
jgi:hypothetical protein